MRKLATLNKPLISKKDPNHIIPNNILYTLNLLLDQQNSPY